MSNEIIQFQKEIFALENNFNEIASHKLVDFKTECHFALNLLRSNSSLQTAAKNNPKALESAILNIAAVGISLNPVRAEAFLVPRGGIACLDISFRGLVKLATDSGAVDWVSAEVVCEKDDFTLGKMGDRPQHNYDPFSTDRGAVKGVYAVAKLSSGDYQICPMSLKECLDIRDKSPAGRSGNGPWKDFQNEMMKKTAVKRLCKMLPKTNTRLHTAIDILNNEAGEGIQEEKVESTYVKVDYAKKDELIKSISTYFGGLCAGKTLQEKGNLMVDLCCVNKWDNIKQKTIEELEIILNTLKKIVLGDKNEIVITTQDIPFTDKEQPNEKI